MGREAMLPLVAPLFAALFVAALVAEVLQGGFETNVALGLFAVVLFTDALAHVSSPMGVAQI
jgi:hypothetical protein